MTLHDEEPAAAPLDVLASHVEHFRLRVLQDALTEATSSYWLHRARTLQEARPRPGDYTGRATSEQLAARDQRLTEAIAACRHRATLGPLYAAEETDDVWEEADATWE